MNVIQNIFSKNNFAKSPPFLKGVGGFRNLGTNKQISRKLEKSIKTAKGIENL